MRRRLRALLRGKRETSRSPKADTLSAPKPVSIAPRPKYTMDDWKPVYPELWDWHTWKEACSFPMTAEGWQDQVQELGNGLYLFQCFSPDLLQKLASEISTLERWADENKVEITPPNSMHDYGITLEILGLEKIIQCFISELAVHFVYHYFPEFGPYPIDHHHSFTVTYGQAHNRSLGFHADDSEVTFNFCLGGDFIGSELYFQGRRCFQHLQTEHRPEEYIELEQRAGFCLVHAGMHRHGVLPILHGERRSLIVWARSTQYREESAAECADWCGILAPNSSSI